jgi:O-antigen biosynthesis protein
VGAGAGTSIDVGGFRSGDTLDITNPSPDTINLSPKQVWIDFGEPALASASHGSYAFYGSSGEKLVTGTDGTLVFEGSYSGEEFLLQSDGSGGTDITLGATCFARGTLILTPHGERAIEDLQIGEQVLTLTGCAQIRWIGRRNYVEAALAERPDARPIMIRAGALGDFQPRRDLHVSAEHALYIGGSLVPAGLLTNGVSIFADPEVRSVSYYHLEFSSHEIIFAHGVAAESFVDDHSRQMFDNASEFALLYPDKARCEAHFYAPRVEDGELLQAIRQRIAAHAALSEGRPIHPATSPLA